MMDAIEIFNQNAKRYDAWYIKHWYAYQSELIAIRSVLPEFSRGVEIGVGTGRFAIPLGINVGVEPAEGMAQIAEARGLRVIRSMAEDLPFPEHSFDLVLVVVSICFFKDVELALQEIRRILIESGHLIIGLIPADSLVGQFYFNNKLKPFYSYAQFWTVKKLISILEHKGFAVDCAVQTLFDFPWMLAREDAVIEGFSTGSFVALRAIKV